jgi:hypothetical protein
MRKVLKKHSKRQANIGKSGGNEHMSVLRTTCASNVFDVETVMKRSRMSKNTDQGASACLSLAGNQGRCVDQEPGHEADHKRSRWFANDERMSKNTDQGANACISLAGNQGRCVDQEPGHEANHKASCSRDTLNMLKDKNNSFGVIGGHHSATSKSISMEKKLCEKRDCGKNAGEQESNNNDNYREVNINNKLYSMAVESEQCNSSVTTIADSLDASVKKTSSAAPVTKSTLLAKLRTFSFTPPVERSDSNVDCSEKSSKGYCVEKRKDGRSDSGGIP